MNHRTDTARATAEAKIREAEEADFLCFLAHVQDDLGPDLAAFLDQQSAYWVHAASFDPLTWKLGVWRATAAVRFPGCTEILVTHQRRTPNNQKPTYHDLTWTPEKVAGLDDQWGRFAVVRYRVELGRPSGPVVETYPSREWLCTDDIDRARRFAERGFTERQGLEADVKERKERADNELLQRLGNRL